jgi:hypothetical protein
MNTQYKTPSITNKTQTFRFRAELQADIIELVKIIPLQKLKAIAWEVCPITRCNTTCTLTARMSLKRLRSIILQVPDGHVMYETAALLNNYTGERNYRLGTQYRNI